MRTWGRAQFHPLWNLWNHGVWRCMNRRGMVSLHIWVAGSTISWTSAEYGWSLLAKSRQVVFGNNPHIQYEIHLLNMLQYFPSLCWMESRANVCWHFFLCYEHICPTTYVVLFLKLGIRGLEIKGLERLCSLRRTTPLKLVVCLWQGAVWGLFVC